MPELPSASSFTGAGVDEAAFKAQLTTLLSYLSTLFGTAGTQAAALTALGAPLNGTLAKTAAYTVVAADRGKLIDCTNTWTLTLTAAATLGAGFAFAVRNSGTGTITIDGNLSELVDGATTIALAAGESAMLACNGSAWKTVGRAVTPPSGAFQQMKVYTATSTWTKPAGLKRVKVTVVGGGGKAGATVGGGGGGAAIKVIEAASLGATETATVGAGATASVGGTSSFGAHCSATGGSGTGAGGVGTGGTYNVPGSLGGSSHRWIDGVGNDVPVPIGGSSIMSPGASGQTSAALYGGGSGSGNGAAGIIIVEEFF